LASRAADHAWSSATSAGIAASAPLRITENQGDTPANISSCSSSQIRLGENPRPATATRVQPAVHTRDVDLAHGVVVEPRLAGGQELEVMPGCVQEAAREQRDRIDAVL